jgi:SAM-dependent methyltransferase
MSSIIENKELFVCPACKNSLDVVGGSFHCGRCNELYPVVNDFMADFTPRAKHHVLDNFQTPYAARFYEEQLNTPFEFREHSCGWGAFEKLPRWHRNLIQLKNKYLHEVLGIKKTSYNKKIFCDISGGAGNHIVPFTKYFKLLIYCDLSIDNMNFMYRRVKNEGIDNILLVRSSYFNLPFKNSYDVAICIDSLEFYGLVNDAKVIQEIQNGLNPCGKAIFDLHNKRPFRNNTDIIEYGKEDVEKLRSLVHIETAKKFCHFPPKLLFSKLINPDYIRLFPHFLWMCTAGK